MFLNHFTSFPIKKRVTSSALAFLLILGSSCSQALNILMVNDDGCNAEGINILMDALETAGHTVTMVAPAGNQSGKGTLQHFLSSGYVPEFFVSNTDIEGTNTSASNRKCVSVTEPHPDNSDNDMIVTASPIDSVRVGLDIVMADNPPDLVISGANEGENIGITALSSGTVSAAKWAILEGYPAIAVSTGKNISGEEAYAATAAVTVKLVAELVAKKRSGLPLLPEGMGLNVNYPSVLPTGVTAVQGIRYTEVKSFTTTAIGPVLDENNRIFSSINLSLLLKPLETSGITLGEEDSTDEGQSFAAGYVTISTIDGDQNANRRKQALTGIKLRDLSL